MATFMERLAFLQKVPTLMKATADDENPCPGYLFEEIGKISHESVGCGQCLLEYLLERLQMESCHVKLKVLKIFVHLCANGSNNFLTELRRNSTFIQQASVYSGPPDPIHGTAFYQKVRHTAQEVARLLFTDILSNKSSISPPSQPPPTMGMGSGTHHRSGMQGFGYSPGAAGGDSLLDKIQKAAEVMASAVLPPTEHQGIRLHESHYRAVVAPSTSIEMAVPACAYNVPPRKPKAITQWCPGQVGGGWEETDSGNSSSHNSSQDIGANSRASLGSKSAGTGSHSGASRESSGDLSERVEALQLGDCGQEMSLINRLTAGSRVFLSREESQHFIKECFILNCEVVLDLLSNKLQDPSNTVKMRALCSVSCLLTSDLLSLEQMFGATQRRLCRLSEGAPGSVANKATKILRQFEALMGGSPHTPTQDAATNTQPPTSTYSDPLLSTHTTDNEDLNHNQPDISATGGTQVQYEPPSSSSLAFDQIDSSAETTNDSKDEKRSPLQQNQTEPCWPSEAGELESSNGGCLSSPAEIQLEQPIVSPLSLFNGMELVRKGRPLFQRETSVTKDTLKENPAMQNSIDICETNVGAPSVYTTAAPDSSHPVSAFSFLSF